MENKELNQETNQDTNQVNAEDLQRQLEEAKAQLEAEKSNYTKLKSSFDKVASELSGTKKTLQSKMTEEEVRKAEADELNAKNAQELNELKAKLELQTNTKKFLGFGLDEAKATECANNINDIDKVLSIIKSHTDETIKKKESELINKRPDPQVGGSQRDEEDAFLKGFNS